MRRSIFKQQGRGVGPRESYSFDYTMNSLASSVMVTSLLCNIWTTEAILLALKVSFYRAKSVEIELNEKGSERINHDNKQ